MVGHTPRKRSGLPGVQIDWAPSPEAAAGVTPAVLRDIAHIANSWWSPRPVGPVGCVNLSLGPGPYFDVAVIHHTHSGSTLLADDERRHGFAQRNGADEQTLNDTPVLDPARTVATDVKRVLWDQAVPMDVRASGHVHDVWTGLVTLVVDAKPKKQAPRRGRARLVCRVARWPETGATSRRTAAGSQPATPGPRSAHA